ncbi:nuclear transport factor 2 family protein [Cryobacterium soli]|uniref:nuclear transport factor 2 family protein n=1 Tax=Cryobacterium soli TaxID=2220095 RepID=UPI000E74F397|nr:nuclear transport factor 2 family protein [Cryobacterium soli]
MTDLPTTRLAEWMSAYVAAWASNEPDEIRALFSDDARYRTEPYAEPWVGPEKIIDGWLHLADGPGTFDFDWEAVAVTPEVSVIQGTTRYATGPVYSNLWVIRFAPDGRASEFTEWWMDQAYEAEADDTSTGPAVDHTPPVQ